MPNVQRLCTARAAAKARALGLLVSYVTLANGCFAGARQTLTVFTGPASKHLTLKVPTSHQFNPESSSLTPTVPPMETPPIHVLLALDAQILGGRVDAEISTESTPTVTESSAGDEGSSPPPSPPPPGAPINVELQQLRRENKRLKTAARGDNWTVTSTYYTGGNLTVASRQSRRTSRAPEHRRLRAVVAVPPSPVTE